MDYQRQSRDMSRTIKRITDACQTSSGAPLRFRVGGKVYVIEFTDSPTQAEVPSFSHLPTSADTFDGIVDPVEARIVHYLPEGSVPEGWFCVDHFGSIQGSSSAVGLVKELVGE